MLKQLSVKCPACNKNGITFFNIYTNSGFVASIFHYSKVKCNVCGKSFALKFRLLPFFACVGPYVAWGFCALKYYFPEGMYAWALGTLIFVVFSESLLNRYFTKLDTD